MTAGKASIYSFRGGRFMDADQTRIADIKAKLKAGEI